MNPISVNFADLVSVALEKMEKSKVYSIVVVEKHHQLVPCACTMFCDQVLNEYTLFQLASTSSVPKTSAKLSVGNGIKKSLIQMSWEAVSRVENVDEVFVATDISGCRSRVLWS